MHTYLWENDFRPFSVKDYLSFGRKMLQMDPAAVFELTHTSPIGDISTIKHSIIIVGIFRCFPCLAVIFEIFFFLKKTDPNKHLLHPFKATQVKFV